MIIDPPIDTGSCTLDIPGIVKVPSIKSLSLYPTNNEILKYDFGPDVSIPDLVKISTSDTDALVFESLLFVRV